MPPRLYLDVPTSGSLHLCRFGVSASLSSFLGVLISVFPVLGLPTLSVPVSGPPPVWVCLPLTVFVGLSVYLSTSVIQDYPGPVSIAGSSHFCCSLSLHLLVSPGLSARQGSVFFLLLFTLLPWHRGRSVASKGS